MTGTASTSRGAVIVGSGGIGRVIAHLLARRGYRVVLGWHKNLPAEPEVMPGQDAARIHLVQVQVEDPGSCRDLFAYARKNIAPLNTIVNCFGPVLSGSAIRSSPDDVNALISCHQVGVINVCRSGVFSLMKAGGGAVINVGAVSSELAIPGLSIYSSVKAGVVAYTRTLAMEIAPHAITANVIVPGFVDSGPTARQSEQWKEAVARHIPLGRLCHPQEVAELVAFLASEHARYITGQTFTIDGGLSLGPLALARELAQWP